MNPPISLLLYTIIVVVNSFALPRRWLALYGAIAIMAFNLEVSSSLGWISYLNQLFGLIAQTIFALHLDGTSAAVWFLHSTVDYHSHNSLCIDWDTIWFLFVGIVILFFGHDWRDCTDAC